LVEERLVRVAAGLVTLDGTLGLPEDAHAIVLFAHGSGSSRHSSRNYHVARTLNEAHLTTLLIDLLTADEEVPLSPVQVIQLNRFLPEMRCEKQLVIIPGGYCLKSPDRLTK
jgi:hypothetical protein